MERNSCKYSSSLLSSPKKFSIYFYNHERIQTKTGVAPLSLRHSA